MTIHTLETRIDGGHTFQFAGLDNQQFIAGATLYLNPSPEKSERNQADLYSVFVHPEYRGKGYAKQMVERVLEVAKHHQKSSVALQAHHENHPAIKLYQGLGFIPYTEPDEDGMVAYYHLIASN